MIRLILKFVWKNIGPGVAKTILMNKVQILPVSYDDLEFVDGAGNR